MSNLLTLDWAYLSELLLMPTCILIVALMVGIALNRLLNQKIERHLKIDEFNLDIKSIFFRALRGIPINFCLMTGLYWIVNTSNLPEGLSRIFSYFLFGVIVFTLTRVLERTLSGVVAMKLSNASNASQSTLLDTIFKTVIYASGALIFLQYCGISVAPIITAMGVGGMAVALGLQETLANIFSGLQLILSKQMKVNDYIKLSTGDEGRVTDINWRFTTITPASDGSVVVIPNKTIAGSITTNYSKPRDDIVITIPIGVSYDSDLDQVERVTVEVARDVMQRVDGYQPTWDDNGVDRNPLAPTVRFHTFADSSINFNVFLHSTQFKAQFVLKHEFIKEITKRYREEKIEIPYPIRTVIKSEN